jgi:NAD(P)-dependent dehydrogenase (short-subunit alcohol dehydrogenase family)
MSYFVLTLALRPQLIAAAPSRVVNTASDAHRGAKLDFDDLQCVKKYKAFTAYGRSKLSNILFTRELARKLAGTGVTANCLIQESSTHDSQMVGMVRCTISSAL